MQFFESTRATPVVHRSIEELLLKLLGTIPRFLEREWMEFSPEAPDPSNITGRYMERRGPSQIQPVGVMGGHSTSSQRHHHRTDLQTSDLSWWWGGGQTESQRMVGRTRGRHHVGQRWNAL
jgi:hypothetical protein